CARADEGRVNLLVRRRRLWRRRLRCRRLLLLAVELELFWRQLQADDDEVFAAVREVVQRQADLDLVAYIEPVQPRREFDAHLIFSLGEDIALCVGDGDEIGELGARQLRIRAGDDEADADIGAEPDLLRAAIAVDRRQLDTEADVARAAAAGAQISGSIETGCDERRRAGKLADAFGAAAGRQAEHQHAEDNDLLPEARHHKRARVTHRNGARAQEPVSAGIGPLI